MAKVSREMAERAGINIDALLVLLVKNAAAELTTYYYYTVLRNNIAGIEAEGIKEIVETARIEDRNHFEALVPRIYELGGKLPDDMIEFHNISACQPSSLPKDPSVKNILEVILDAERCAVRGYTRLSQLTAGGKDPRTYDLVSSILNEKTEHEAWFEEILTGNPSGHFLRRGETSPFVSKFLR